MSSPRSHSRQDQAQVLGRSPWLRLLPTVLMREDPKGVEERVLAFFGSGGSVGDGGGGGIPGLGVGRWEKVAAVLEDK